MSVMARRSSNGAAKQSAPGAKPRGGPRPSCAARVPPMMLVVSSRANAVEFTPQRERHAGCDRRAQAERRLKADARGCEGQEERPASPSATVVASARRLSRPQRWERSSPRQRVHRRGRAGRSSRGTARRSPGRLEQAHERIPYQNDRGQPRRAPAGTQLGLFGVLRAQIREPLSDHKSRASLGLPAGRAADQS